MREHITLLSTSKPSRVAIPVVRFCESVHAQFSPLRSHCSTSAEQLFAHVSSPNSSKIVGVFSIARRKRNHVLSSIRRASTHEILPRSKTTTPHPPLCSRMSVVFRACSSLFHGLLRKAASFLPR